MSRQKAKGTRMETGLVRYLTASLDDPSGIHRAALAGSSDEGDVHGIRKGALVGIAEVKNHRQVTPGLVAGWREETLRERENAHADFAVLVMHRNGADQTGNSPSYGRNVVQMTMRDLMIVSGRYDPRDDADGMHGKAQGTGDAAGVTEGAHGVVPADGIWVSLDMDTLVTLLNADGIAFG